MIFKKTWLNVSDGTNVNWLQTFHLYKGFKRKSSKVGFFVKSSARVVTPPRLEYKGFKVKFNKKGDICRSIIIRTKYNLNRPDGSVLFFKNNNSILLKKKQEPKSKYIYGPSSSMLKRKKFSSLFKIII